MAARLSAERRCQTRAPRSRVKSNVRENNIVSSDHSRWIRGPTQALAGQITPEGSKRAGRRVMSRPCGGVRQPEAGRTLDQGQHVGDVFGDSAYRRERDRGATAHRRLQKPYLSAGHSQALAVGSASECEPQWKQNSRPRRARVRSSSHPRWAAGSYARSASGERRAKIGLQNLAYNIRSL